MDDDISMNNDMSAMEDDMEMGGDMSMDNDNETQENPFDSNFDAGVEADEEEDPKKYIEQLSGKLSQSLNKYQSSLPQPDEETAKYAAGMVIKAAIKGLSQEDVEDILNKLKDVDKEKEDDLEDNSEDNLGDNNFDNELDSENNLGEAKDNSFNKEHIEEIYQNLINKNDDIQDKPIKNTSYKKKPYLSPNF